jgi:hypothetical protein
LSGQLEQCFSFLGPAMTTTGYWEGAFSIKLVGLLSAQELSWPEPHAYCVFGEIPPGVGWQLKFLSLCCSIQVLKLVCHLGLQLHVFV